MNKYLSRLKYILYGIDRFFYGYFALKLGYPGITHYLFTRNVFEAILVSHKTFAMSVCSAFLRGITGAESEKITKKEIKVATRGFIRWNFNNNYCNI